MNKVFGIGLSRTGTTSLWSALNEIGIKSKKFPRIFRFKGRGVGENGVTVPINIEVINDYQGWVDTPVARFYKLLDERYPGSKFILTVRNIDDWLLSCKYFFKEVPQEIVESRKHWDTLQLHYDLYSAISYDEDKFKKAYYEHKEDILNYFNNRLDDLLLFDLCGGDGWDILCSFLKKPLPDKNFPKLNINRDIKERYGKKEGK